MRRGEEIEAGGVSLKTACMCLPLKKICFVTSIAMVADRRLRSVASPSLKSADAKTARKCKSFA